MVCRCGGDLVRRHHAIRDTLGNFLTEAGLNPEREKHGLLPLRPTDTDEPTADTVPAHQQWQRSRRRPADIWVRRWGSNPARNGTAFDVAVTSVFRGPPSCTDPGDLAIETHLRKYSDYKCSYLDTALECTSQAITFVPLIMEGHAGGWDSTLTSFLQELAPRIRVQVSATAASVLAQRLSVAFHMEAAKALLRRSTPALDRFQ